MDEIAELERNNKYLRVIHLISSEIKPKQNNITNMYKGFLTANLLDKITDQNYSNYTFFICGPKALKDSVSKILVSREVNDEQIIIEEFSPSVSLQSDPEDRKKSIPFLTYVLSAGIIALASFFFMAIDLVRAVPKLANAQAHQTPSSIPSQPTLNTTSNNTDSNNVTNNNAPTPTPTQQPAPPTNSYTYTPPTTSVS
jgi:hypothetical protein